MKRISVMLLALSLPLAHAMPTTNAKVISVKEWSSNNANVSFHVKPTIKVSSKDPNTRYIAVEANTKAQNGTTTAPNSYTAESGVYLYNDTDETQNMGFTVIACIDKFDDQSSTHFDAQCGHHYESVSVPAGSEYRKEFSPELIVNFHEAGDYRIESYAYAYSDNDKPDRMQRQFNASSSAKITVTN